MRGQGNFSLKDSLLYGLIVQQSLIEHLLHARHSRAPSFSQKAPRAANLLPATVSQIRTKWALKILWPSRGNPIGINWVASAQGISEAHSSYPPKIQLELTNPSPITCTWLLLIPL